VRSEADRRSQYIRLTRKGNALARKATEVSRTMEQDVLRHLAMRENLRIERFELAEPSLDDIFVNVVQKGEAGNA